MGTGRAPGTGEFQTLHLCEDPPHAPANSNFILTLIQRVLAFKYHIPLKLGLFYSALSINTRPTVLGLLSPSLTPTCVGETGARLASSRVSDD